MKNLIIVIGLPLLALNWFGMIVGSIWLAILGEWWKLIFSILSIIFGTLTCGLLLIPGLIFSGPGVLLQSKEHWVPRLASYPLLALGFLWMYFVMSSWALGNLFYLYEKASFENLIPSMLLAYGVATTPWSSMAQKEAYSDVGSYAPMTAFFLQAASAQVLVSLLIFDSKFKTSVIIFLVIMFICLVFQSAIAIREISAKNRINKLLGL
jgi:hypothetical protein